MVEVYEDITDYTGLGQGGWAAAEFDMVVPESINQLSSDYSTGGTFYGYPTTPLIDLTTMTVLVADCWDYPSSGAHDYEGCIADHI